MFAAAYGIKVRCYWELFALGGAPPPPNPTITHKKKKGGPFTPWLLTGCMEILFLKLAASIFGLY
jgi:hypothetical protein